MTKTLRTCLALILAAGLGACAEESAQPQNTPEEVPEQTETQEGRTLLVYFSRAGENWEVGNVEKGNTRIAAEYIADMTGADVFEIDPVNPYPVSYNEVLTAASDEKAAKARPEYKNDIEDWESYTDIILGYPIWHGDMPMIVYTFLESHDFTGKTVYPFDTHGGSGLSGTVERIRTSTGTEVRDGLALTGKTVQNDFESVRGSIDSWIETNHLAE